MFLRFSVSCNTFIFHFLSLYLPGADLCWGVGGVGDFCVFPFGDIKWLSSCTMTRYTHYYIERLDQGHLHPKLEVPRLTRPCRISNPVPHGGSSLEKGELSSKETFEQLINIYSEHLHMTVTQYFR